MTIALGIDTGGTYTDAVLVDHDSGQVLASAKALTTPHNLALGIGAAAAQVFAENGSAVTPAMVDLVALSTTLATNAIVEGQGSPVCLLLIGYDTAVVQQYGFTREFATSDVVYLPGGHDGQGDELAPLDEEAARAAILAHRDQVAAIAVSGYFSVRNPAHELRVRALVEELTRQPDGSSLPVTCGHELTTNLNAIRRATTTALNARLIPLLRELIGMVRHTLDELGVAAPLMVVKGDGSLVQAGWALQRPIETILSGPAASVVGAWHLAGRGDVWVVDMGGTTTDIAVLNAGRPGVNPEGARVGGWRTMVEAVDVHTVGLGGDSQVSLNGAGIEIGPRRVVPLCMLAAHYPQIVAELQRQITQQRHGPLAGRFALATMPRSAWRSLPTQELALLESLAAGPRALLTLAAEDRYRLLLSRYLERLTGRRLLLQAGFTPTDALHVLGQFTEWHTPAARLGAELLARRAGLSPEAFCQQVVTAVSNQVATELVDRALSKEAIWPDWDREPVARALLERALCPAAPARLACRLTLSEPIVAIGAPVAAYLPHASQQLHTELLIPDHAEVANAVGAVVGGVVQQRRVVIRALDGLESVIRVHLPDGVRDFATLAEAVTYTQQTMSSQLEQLARQAGADQVEVKIRREDRIAPIREALGGELYLGTELIFTAVGRPRIAQND